MPKPSKAIKKQKQKTVKYTAFSLAGALLVWFIWVEAIDPYRQVSVEEVPLITAGNEPFKVKPTDPGGDKVAYTDIQIYRMLGENIDSQPPAENLLPAEEEPRFSIEKPAKLSEKSNQKTAKKIDPIDSSDLSELSQTVYGVQILSLRSREATQKAQKKFLLKHPGLFESLQFHIRAVQVANKGTFYRLYVGPFAKWSRAQEICKSFLANNINCFVFQE